MSYTPKTWVDGEIIYADDMNHLEQGVEAAANAEKVVSAQVETIASVTQEEYDALTTKDAATLYLVKE